MTDPKRIVLTQENCGGCTDAKQVFKEDLAAGRLQEVDVHTERGQKLAAAVKARTTPTFVEEQPDGSLRLCKPKQGKDGEVFLACDIIAPEKTRTTGRDRAGSRP